MDIYLVRHAKSAHDPSKWSTDAIRPLAEIGEARQLQAAKGMKNLGLNYTSAWVSPFKRAQQTLDIIQSICQTEFIPKVVDELKVWGDPHLVKRELELYYSDNQQDKVIIVGHNPNMSDLVELLTGNDIYMRTSDLVHIAFDGKVFEMVQYYPRKFLIDES